MHKATAALCIALGILVIPFVAFWCFFAAGFGAFDRDGYRYLVFLAAGPLSLLPAGIVGRKRPLVAAAWLLGGSLFCYFWHLCVNHRFEGYGIPLPGRAFESWLPIALICPPMSLLGAGFLSVGWPHARVTVAGWWQSPAFRRRFHIIAATLAAAGTVVFAVWQLMQPVWVITVTPEGQPPRSIRFNPMSHQNPREGPGKYLALEAKLKDLFTPLFKNTDRTVLGTSHWKGSAVGGTSVWTIERNPGGLIRVLQNGSPVDHNWVYPDPQLAFAMRGAVSQILTQAWREHAPPGRY